MTDTLTTCCVPLCKHRTRRLSGEVEWICAAHWKDVPKKSKRILSLAKRRYRRFGYNFMQYPAGSPNRLAAVKAHRQVYAIWSIIKKQATRRAFP